MTTHPIGIDIESVSDRRSERDWHRVPLRILGNDPHWVQPLHFLERRRLSKKHNPFFTFGEAVRFIAYVDGAPAGRISAQINRRHLARYDDATGQFGFFDCIDNPEVALRLLEAASHWLRCKGLARMTGPFNFSINEEAGLLVDGFDAPPAMMMAHGAPWYGALLESAGCRKVRDLYAYRMRPSDAPAQLIRLAKLAQATKRLTVRKFDMRDYDREVDRVLEIFNDAWSDNWGFVELSDPEVAAFIAETKKVLRDGWGRFVLVDGEIAGFIFALPDINRVIAPFGGRLLPWNWARLGLKFWRNDWETGRVPLLGLRRKYRSDPLAPAMLSLLVAGLYEESRAYPIDWIEFSWVLEDNRSMCRLGELATGGGPAKTYRIYERDIAAPAQPAADLSTSF